MKQSMSIMEMESGVCVRARARARAWRCKRSMSIMEPHTVASACMPLGKIDCKSGGDSAAVVDRLDAKLTAKRCMQTTLMM